jgi:hypothetical protein
VEAEAMRAGIPALRLVREATLSYVASGAAAAPRAGRGARRPGDELVHQLARILNNLRQLQRVGEIDGQEAAVGRVERTAKSVEAAIRAAPAPRARLRAGVLDAVVAAGVTINALAHRANGSEELPPDAELRTALDDVEAAARGVTE